MPIKSNLRPFLVYFTINMSSMDGTPYNIRKTRNTRKTWNTRKTLKICVRQEKKGFQAFIFKSKYLKRINRWTDDGESSPFYHFMGLQTHVQGVLNMLIS